MIDRLSDRCNDQKDYVTRLLGYDITISSKCIINIQLFQAQSNYLRNLFLQLIPNHEFDFCIPS